MSPSTEHTNPAEAGRRVFTRVIAGVDGSAEAVEAARQASILADGRDLTLLAAWNLEPPAVVAPGGYVGYVEDEETARQHAGQAVETAAEAMDATEKVRRTILQGIPWQAILDECTRRGSTLLAVGSHGQGRARGILTGSTATELMHKAPCSVLVAREAPESFPERIVVGVDGSSESAVAYATARELAERFGAELWPVVALGGGDVDRERAAEIVGRHHEELPDEPVRALVVASADADLVVVGSRGLHGWRALGSVSERVGHEAHCSVLIVR
jgi:nucleotide-binding universal stress UspA family protein